MAVNHLVRVGAMGHVGRFASADATRYRRRMRVVVRTSRGLETGEVLGPSGDDTAAPETDGTILRAMTVEDDLLSARLEQHKQAAFAACRERMDQRGIATALLDVETLLDGSRIYFYFLGDVTAELAGLVDELAELYQAETQLERFAETLTTGCGPHCGTEQADGGGGMCVACVSGCAIAGACGSSGNSASR